MKGLTIASKHEDSIQKFGRIMIAFKLHFLGERKLTREKLAELNRMANEIRAELEGCKRDCRKRY